MDELLKSIKDAMESFFIIANWGHWHSGVFPVSVYRSMMGNLSATVALQNGRALWRTMTPAKNMRKRPQFDASMARAAIAAGLSVYDAWQVVVPLLSPGFAHILNDTYWDHLHFRGCVYAELNNFVLNLLCNEVFNLGS